MSEDILHHFPMTPGAPSFHAFGDHIRHLLRVILAPAVWLSQDGSTQALKMLCHEFRWVAVEKFQLFSQTFRPEVLYIIWYGP